MKVKDKEPTVIEINPKWKGEILQIIPFSKKLTAAEHKKVVKYLYKKWGL